MDTIDLSGWTAADTETDSCAALIISFYCHPQLLDGLLCTN